MRLIKTITALALLLAPSAATAELANLPLSRFSDTTSNLVWIDVDQFFGLSYDQITQLLGGSRYRLATKSEVDAMWTSGGRTIGGISSRTGGLTVDSGCCNNFRLAGWYDDTGSGTDPLRAGVATIRLQNATETFTLTDDARLSSQSQDVNSGAIGAWIIGDFGFSPTPGAYSLDFDGDGVDEKVVYRATTGTWYIKFSAVNLFSSVQWGLPGDQPVAGNFDFDGRPDLAVFRPSTGIWYLKLTTFATGFNSEFGESFQQFGLAGDKPIRTDFDQDGQLDFSVFRPSTAHFFHMNSSNGKILGEQFGLAGDVAVQQAVEVATPTTVPTPKKR
jgi:hypothetical protein